VLGAAEVFAPDHPGRFTDAAGLRMDIQGKSKMHTSREVPKIYVITKGSLARPQKHDTVRIRQDSFSLIKCTREPGKFQSGYETG